MKKTNTCTYEEIIYRIERDGCDINDVAYINDTLYVGDHMIPEQLEDEVLQRLHLKAVVKAAYDDNGLPSKWEAKKMDF